MSDQESTPKGAGVKGQGLNIHQKIAAMKAELVVDKTGYDEQNEYYYFKADDVARDVHKIMTEYNVVSRTTIDPDGLNIDNYWDKQGRNRPRVTAICTVAFIDADGSGFLDTQVVATGSDIGGDKATRKLMVQAFKEAAIDVFGVTEGMEAMDSDNYAEAEPDVEKDDDPELPEIPKTDSKVLGERIKDLIEDPSQEHIDSDMVVRLGREVAQEVLGEVPGDRVWRKDARVLEPLVKRLESGELPLDKPDSESA